jgi:hypothetical protein
MADESRSGVDWEIAELEIIVADYFAMLADELAGRPYVKSRHNEAVNARTGRSKGSVEFKHQNISAVLDALGMPWILGYKPRSNYQNALFDAIERHLTVHPAILEPVARPAPPPGALSEVFVPPPMRVAVTEPIPAGLVRLVRKFDPVERDHRNRSLGKAGEAFVFDIERRQLVEKGRSDLARRVRWVADEDGDGAGFDVLSFDPAGGERLIEVKTTNGSALTPFFLTRNECALAAERPADWRIFRVHLFAMEPRIFSIGPPLASAVNLTAETWRASF